MAPETARAYPSELPVLALRQTVVFPLTLQPLAINRPMSIEAVNRALAGDRLLFLSLQHGDSDEPHPDHLHKVGTIAAIRQMAKVPTGGIHIIVEGLMRAKSDAMTKNGLALRATVTPIPDVAVRSLEVERLWVRGRPMRLEARHGARQAKLTPHEPLNTPTTGITSMLSEKTVTGTEVAILIHAQCAQAKAMKTLYATPSHAFGPTPPSTRQSSKTSEPAITGTPPSSMIQAVYGPVGIATG